MTYPLGRYRLAGGFLFSPVPLVSLLKLQVILYLFGRGTQVCSPGVCSSGHNAVFTMLNREKEKTTGFYPPCLGHSSLNVKNNPRGLQKHLEELKGV